MSGNFGEATYEQGAGDATASNAVGSSNEPSIDINDPRLTSEALDDNTSVDAYAVPPPAPDGKWRAKLSQVDINDGNGQPQRFLAKSYPKMENGRPFLVTNVEASLIDLQGKYDGVKLTEYWVKTLVDSKKGTSQASTIVTKAGGTLPPKSTDADRMNALLKTLAGLPEVIVETAWEASCQSCQEAAKKSGTKAPRPFLTGMHRFPHSPVAGGGHDPNVACPTCKGMARAQVRIVRYWSVKEAKADRGL
jgi:hypothetical protein